MRFKKHISSVNKQLVYIYCFTFLLTIIIGCEQIDTLRNGPPEINSFNIPKEVHYGESVVFKVSAFDPEEDDLKYIWTVSDGVLKGGSKAEIEWTAPALPDEGVVPPRTVTVHVSVRDGGEKQVADSANILVYSKAYKVANSLKGVYVLVRTQVNGETIESLDGSMRLTTTTFTRQFEEGSEFYSGSYELIEPYDDKKGTINWFSDGEVTPSVSTFTWDGKLLILFWANTSTTHVYEKN